MCAGPEIAAVIAAMSEAAAGVGTAVGEGASALAAPLVGEGGALTETAYGMLPGMKVGSDQAAMLASQTADFGGSGLLATKGAAGGASGLLSGGGGAGSSAMMAKMGMDMMNPQQQPQQRAPAMPMGGGQQGPLTMPYGNPQGNSLGTSMPRGLLGESEEERKRKLLAMGIRI